MAKLEKINPRYAGVNTRVNGIPCIAVVTSYTAGAPHTYYEEGWDEEMEFELYDRKGYRAKWLEKMMTDNDIAKVIKDCKGRD